MHLNAHGLSVLVLDGGEHAVPTIASLLGEGAAVTLHADAACAALEDLADRGLIQWTREEVDDETFDLVVRRVPTRPVSRPRAPAG